jgi:hypothetical protein
VCELWEESREFKKKCCMGEGSGGVGSGEWIFENYSVLNWSNFLRLLGVGGMHFGLRVLWLAVSEEGSCRWLDVQKDYIAVEDECHEHMNEEKANGATPPIRL